MIYHEYINGENIPITDPIRPYADGVAYLGPNGEIFVQATEDLTPSVVGDVGFFTIRNNEVLPIEQPDPEADLESNPEFQKDLKFNKALLHKMNASFEEVLIEFRDPKKMISKIKTVFDQMRSSVDRTLLSSLFKCVPMPTKQVKVNLTKIDARYHHPVVKEGVIAGEKDSQKLELYVDVGSEMNIISPEEAEHIGVRPLFGRVQFEGITGQGEEADKVEFDLTIENHTVTVEAIVYPIRERTGGYSILVDQSVYHYMTAKGVQFK